MTEHLRRFDGDETWNRLRDWIKEQKASERLAASLEAVFKLLYLALRNIAKKWTMSVHDWKAALNRFAIVYENRLPVE